MQVKLRTDATIFGVPPFDGALDWQIQLNPGIPFQLHVRGGGNECHLNLEQLLITKISISTGASSTDLTLPAAAGHTQVSISAGVAALRIRVPEGVAANIQPSSGLGNIHVDQSRFPRRGNGYESPDYKTAEHKVEIRATASVGSLNIS